MTVVSGSAVLTGRGTLTARASGGLTPALPGTFTLTPTEDGDLILVPELVDSFMLTPLPDPVR